MGSQICPHCHYETDLEFEPGDTLKIDPTREARVLNKLSHSKDAGMSAVYLVERKRSSGVNVRGVLKVAKAKSVHALEREVTYLQRLQHYNIIRLLYDGDGRNPHTAIWSDTKDGQNLQFVALECMPGGSLKQKLQQQGAFDLPEALNVVKAIGQALDHLHLNNTVHLDIKPANILFGTDDRIVLSDFGVARTRQETADLAKRNVRVGTPAYNAPELLSFSTAADHRADIYALGLVLYEMLIGCNPVQFSTTSAGLSTQAHRIQQALEALPKPRELSRKIAPAVEAVILKATHPDLHQRYNSGAEMIEALEQTAAMVQRQKSVKLALAGAGVLLVLLVAMVGATAALSGHAKSDSPADGASQTLAEARPTVSSNGGGVSLGEMAVDTPLPTAAVSDPLPTQPSAESNPRPAEIPKATSTLAAYTTPTPVQTPTSAPVVGGVTTSPTAAAPEPTAITGSKQLIF
ncbi:MAG TPA: serine/threonine-protein kinase, partial [Anaerolineae bacterium]|nr:serine/threonine-protein kinase [Anaerolineae bacterium]